MNTYQEYLTEIEERKAQGLSPKPIDGSELIAEIIAQIKDQANEHRRDSIDFFIYNTLPGTTSAALGKAEFLKEIILGGGNHSHFCLWNVIPYEGGAVRESSARFGFGG